MNQEILKLKNILDSGQPLYYNGIISGGPIEKIWTSEDDETISYFSFKDPHKGALVITDTVLKCISTEEKLKEDDKYIYDSSGGFVNKRVSETLEKIIMENEHKLVYGNTK